MKAIITGVTGQDGYYMTERLLNEGYDVLGLTTNVIAAQAQLARFSSNDRLRILEFDYTRPGAFTYVLEDYGPDMVFNYAAKATGQGMFKTPYEINRLNGGFVVDILEAIRLSPRCSDIVFCQASSSEMFGYVSEKPQSEETPFRPKSPYGAAKLYAHNMVNIYRATYGVRACSAILYNHESIRRSTQFVTKKIANATAQIRLGVSNALILGSLEAKRDWGYAPEYVDAMLRMGRSTDMDDYVVATGKLTTVRDLCEAAFGYVGLDYRDYVRIDMTQTRSMESVDLQGNPEKIRRKLGWEAKKTIDEIMVELVEHEIKHSAKI